MVPTLGQGSVNGGVEKQEEEEVGEGRRRTGRESRSQEVRFEPL